GPNNGTVAMSGEARAKSTKYDARHDTALDAAAAVFAERGYHGAGTSLIEERIGIRQGSLYYYFASKEEALREVCLKGVGDFLSGLAEIAQSGEPTDAKVRAAIVNLLRPLIDRPDYVRTFIAQRQFLPDEARRSIG